MNTPETPSAVSSSALLDSTLLDEFAMRFAPELIKRNTGCGTSWEHVAKDAYDAAEAMMKERKHRVPPNAKLSESARKPPTI